MTSFDSVDAVIEWLEPLGYDAFWRAVESHDIFGPEDRPHCDQVIADGIATFETVLTCMKATARIELTERHCLNHRSTLSMKPDLSVVH